MCSQCQNVSKRIRPHRQELVEKSFLLADIFNSPAPTRPPPAAPPPPPVQEGALLRERFREALRHQAALLAKQWKFGMVQVGRAGAGGCYGAGGCFFFPGCRVLVGCCACWRGLGGRSPVLHGLRRRLRMNVFDPERMYSTRCECMQVSASPPP